MFLVEYSKVMSVKDIIKFILRVPPGGPWVVGRGDDLHIVAAQHGPSYFIVSC